MLRDIDQQTLFKKRDRKKTLLLINNFGQLVLLKIYQKLTESSLVRFNKEGYTYRQIAERIGCSFQHVGYILKRFQETGMFEDRHRTGRPKI